MKTLIISPSGSFYGSEQVLFDYLSKSPQDKNIAVNGVGQFKNRLRALFPNKHIESFNPASLKLFYCRVFLYLFSGKFDSIYLNEGGHVKYCLWLARIFRKKKFIIHIRILEDTNTLRWGILPTPNCRFIVVSEYIKTAFNYPSTLIYDPYLSRKKSYENLKFGPEDSFVVGVIGRVTFTKGVKLINSILDLITLNKQSNHYKFIFFGDISEDVKNTNWFLNLKSDCRVEFAGFVDDTDEIYSKVHCIMHFSEQEPLGRIFLESVDYSTPFIGLKAGGIGELGKLLNLEDFLAQNTDDKGLQIFKILTLVRENYEEAISRVKSARASLIKNFSVEQYVKNIDAILVE